MPYIKESRRQYILDGGTPADVGELNFQLTELVQGFLSHSENLDGRETYHAYNDVLGVLTAMQHEIYRRMVVPFEERKIAENGDVFPRREASYA